MSKFKPGQSGNPNGRPPVSATAKAIREQIANGPDPIRFLADVMAGGPITIPPAEGEEVRETPTPLVPTLTERLTAARILAGKLTPDAKDRPVTFKVGDITGPKDALAAMGRVVKAMGEGEFTPSEATSIMAVVNGYLDAWKASDLEERISKLEAEKA